MVVSPYCGPRKALLAGAGLAQGLKAKALLLGYLGPNPSLTTTGHGIQGESPHHWQAGGESRAHIAGCGENNVK